jgi:Tfp pilus assembly protein PilF
MTLVCALAITTHGSAGLWSDDVTAWRRVVERHPWCAMAFHMFGAANFQAGQRVQAERALITAVELDANLPGPHLYLARLYADRGRRHEAAVAIAHFLSLAPDDPEGLSLQRELQRRGEDEEAQSSERSATSAQLESVRTPRSGRPDT